MFEDTLQQLHADSSVGQVLTVECTEGSNAKATLLLREGAGWRAAASGSAFIGRNGLGKSREGDSKTPVGVLGIRRAFGTAPNPGTSIEYLDVKPTTYACDEDSRYYNQIVDTEEIGYTCSGEHMCEYAEYTYGLETNFNNANVYPLGSAIFIHCKGHKTYTGGCVALDEEFMKQVLLLSGTGLKIVIG